MINITKKLNFLDNSRIQFKCDILNTSTGSFLPRTRDAAFPSWPPLAPASAGGSGSAPRGGTKSLGRCMAPRPEALSALRSVYYFKVECGALGLFANAVQPMRRQDILGVRLCLGRCMAPAASGNPTLHGHQRGPGQRKTMETKILHHMILST